MQIDMEEICKISEPVLHGFKKVEPRNWGILGTLVELETEIGSLGRVITIWENYRHGKKSRHNLCDELSDILFVLVKLIKESGISIKRFVDPQWITSPEKTFSKLMDLAVELFHHYEKDKSLAECRKNVEDMISLVLGFSQYYNVSLLRAHEEEMNLAALWQRIFFGQDGKKKGTLVFVRKMFFSLALVRHKKILDKPLEVQDGNFGKRCD